MQQREDHADVAQPTLVGRLFDLGLETLRPRSGDQRWSTNLDEISSVGLRFGEGSWCRPLTARPAATPESWRQRRNPGGNVGRAVPEGPFHASSFGCSPTTDRTEARITRGNLRDQCGEADLGMVTAPEERRGKTQRAGGMNRLRSAALASRKRRSEATTRRQLLGSGVSLHPALSRRLGTHLGGSRATETAAARSSSGVRSTGHVSSRPPETEAPGQV